MTKLLDDLAEVVRKMRDFESCEGPRVRDIDGKLADARHAAYMLVYRHAAEIERNARDAERYRWLRNDTHGHVEQAILDWHCEECLVKAGESLDQAIDDAMREGGGE